MTYQQKIIGYVNSANSKLEKIQSWGNTRPSRKVFSHRKEQIPVKTRVIRKPTKNYNLIGSVRREFKSMGRNIPNQQIPIKRPIRFIQPQPRQPFESSNRPSPNWNPFEHFDDDVFDDGDAIKLRLFDMNRRSRSQGGTGSCFGLY